MYLKLSILLYLLQVFGIKSECDSYFECLSDFVVNYFVDDKNNTVENINLKNVPEDFVQIQDIPFSDVDKILTDVSILLKSDLKTQHEHELDTVFRSINNQTQIFVKTFDLGKENYTQNTVSTDFFKDELTKLNFEKKENSTENSDKMKANKKVNINQGYKEVIGNICDNEISAKDEEFDELYYDSNEDNSTDYPIIDYVELYKDTTNEDTYIPTEVPRTEVPRTEENLSDDIRRLDADLQYTVDMFKDGSNNSYLEPSCHGNASSSNISDVVFPWIVSIFIKNDSKENQYDYYCDGALISSTAVLTAARCVFTDIVLDPDNLLVILGKRSLHTMAESERAHKIKQIIAHENFTMNNGQTENDLAILIMEDAVELRKTIQVACTNAEIENTTPVATVAWNLSGDLEPVYFEKDKSGSCDNGNKNENTFCATYGDAIALCPNYGGVYVTKQADSHWYLQGIRTDDPAVRGICFNKTVHYTSLKNYWQWIADTVYINKDD